MTCTIGKLRGIRYAAFQVGAARGTDDAQPASSLRAIFQHAFNIRFQSFLGTTWVAASITTSAAPQDVKSGRQSDSNQRPNQSQRRNPLQQDGRADGAEQQRGQRPRQGGTGGGERSRASQGGQPRDRGGPRMRSEDRRGWAPQDSGGSGTGGGGGGSGGIGGGRGLQRLDDRAVGPASLEPHLPRPGKPAAAPAKPPTPPPSALQRWDLVAQNAPQRVFNLIGDPRSGVADDTTNNPFGEVTVDMVHHQPSNEVYWFKYEFAGRQVYGAHRDARLSDYTRNLIYLLRAKDPKRWTIPALAEKFRIRRQRVLAILALKELEAHRLESGKLLSGPLCAYSLPVYLEDVHLDPNTGNPTAAAPPLPPSSAAAAASSPPQAPASASSSGQASSSASSSAAAVAATSARHQVDVVLPQVLSATRRLQSWLLELLREHGYDTVRLREALVSELQHAEELATKVLGGGGGVGGTADGSGNAADGTPASSYLQEELAAYRTAVEGVMAAVEGVVSCSPLLAEERRVASLRAAVELALAAGGNAVFQEVRDLPLSYSTTTATTTTTSSSTAAPGDPADAAMAAGGGASAAVAAPSSGVEEEVQQRLREVLEPVLQAPEPGDDGAALLLHRAFFSLAPTSRGALLRLLPDLSARLNADGVDLARAVKDAAYRGLAEEAAAAAGGGSGGGGADGARKLSVDVFGFAPVASERLAALAEAVGAVEAARAALVGKVAALGPPPARTAGPGGRAATPPPPPPPPPLPSAADLAAARSLVRQYVAADVAWSELQVPVSAVGRRATTTTLDPAKKRRALEVLSEADPTAVARALQTEASLQLRNRRAFTEADAMAAGVGAAAAAEAAAAGRSPPARPGDRASWDALAAYLEVKVAGKVYGTGSGERHLTQLPSFPAFEGYSLDELDRVTEGELSALNRKVAERLDEEMYDRFRQDLLYNLGLRGEKLRRPPPGQPAWPTNLLTALERPVVVYDIAADGSTRYPPLHVANGDGTRRPLNDQEKVFQERRAERPRLPYYMGRISRVPELQ